MRKLFIALVVLPLLSAGSFAELKIELTEERVSRGEFLVTKIVGCDGCHTERALDRYGYPPKKDLFLGGGLTFRDVGDEAITPNITPYALADWKDQQILDAMTRGVSKGGRVLHPSMPYKRYGLMDLEELYSIIAYLRTIEPVEAGPYAAVFEGEFTESKPNFGSVPRPGRDATETEVGEYLVKIAGCNGCHHGHGDELQTGPFFIGGREFELAAAGGLIRSANLTPDEKTGIGAWTRETFISRFHAMRGMENTEVARGNYNTVMHWWSYSYLPDAALGAIYTYLNSIEPVSNSVVVFEPKELEIVESIPLNFSERTAASD